MTPAGPRNTIKELVFAYVRETGGEVDYDELTRRVLELSPNSKWKKSHWAGYKTRIVNGEYSADFPQEIRAKLVNGRPLLAFSKHAPPSPPVPSSDSVRSNDNGVSATARRSVRRKKRSSEPTYPSLLTNEIQRGIALTLARVAHHVHPNVVARMQVLNAAHAAKLRAMLPQEINANDYLYPGSACVFPGVRRAIGTFGHKEKAERNKYNPESGAIIDQNIWPRYFWTYLTLGRGFGGPAWKESGLDRFELAHIYGHKPEERSLEAELFENCDASVKPWGLFTCASNIVLLPKGMAKPTDQLKAVKLCFFKRAVDLYGETVLPGLSGLREAHVPNWYAELDWNEPILPEDWEAKLDRLHEFRIKRLSGIYQQRL